MTQMMCWQEGNRLDGAWHIGSEPFVISTRRDAVAIMLIAQAKAVTFVNHYHTGKLELVPTAWLKPYSVSKIEEPMK